MEPHLRSNEQYKVKSIEIRNDKTFFSFLFLVFRYFFQYFSFYCHMLSRPFVYFFPFFCISEHVFFYRRSFYCMAMKFEKVASLFHFVRSDLRPDEINCVKNSDRPSSTDRSREYNRPRSRPYQSDQRKRSRPSAFPVSTASYSQSR